MASIPAAYGLRGLPGPTGRGVHRGVAWVAQNEPPLLAHGTSSKARSYFCSWERRTTDRPHTMQLARCKMSCQVFSASCEKPESERGHSPPIATRGFLVSFCKLSQHACKPLRVGCHVGMTRSK
jgi:hypothetical protein